MSELAEKYKILKIFYRQIHSKLPYVFVEDCRCAAFYYARAGEGKSPEHEVCAKPKIFQIEKSAQKYRNIERVELQSPRRLPPKRILKSGDY